MEGLSKSRNKGLNFKPRLISSKIYENKTERQPAAFFLLFKSKRLVQFRNMGPFYLTVVDAPLTDVWYKNQAVGVNTISTMLSRMKKRSPLAELTTKDNKPLCKKNNQSKIEIFRISKM